MTSEKIRKLESLSSEVNDFQPVLFELFKKLPNVISVECKQGPSEKGADFVLVKLDDTLAEETYIGVICKVGKITQNHSEVDRQIEECIMYPRFISSGKKQVHLHEIWVVNNSTISSNAEEKINIKNKNTNIKFINGHKVSDLIDKFYPVFWAFNSVSYGQYFTDIELKLATGRDSSFFGMLEAGNQIERMIIKEQVKKNKVTQETLLSAIKKEKYIFLEGHVGSGKSTLIKNLVEKQKAIIKEDENAGFLPLIYHYSEVNETPEELIVKSYKKLDEYKIPSDREIIIIIDGIDEVKDDFYSRELTLRTIVGLVNESDRIKLLVTSRTIDSLQDYERIDKLFTRYSILPLSIKQIIGFVEKICSNEQVSKKLFNGIEKTPLFRFIPRTPISAILLARILNDEVKELPSTMTELYAKYTEVVLGRWDASKGLISQTEYEVIHNVLMNVAEFMMDNSLTCISQSEVENIFLDYLAQRNIDVDENKLLDRLLKRSEVALINSKNLTFSFVHRSFMEYFYAEKLKKKGNVSLDEKIYNMYWTNSYFFYLGLLRDSEESIDRINSIKASDDYIQFTRLFTNGSFYLAAYLTPYEKIQKGVLETFLEAGKLYDDIVNNQCNISLKELSPIVLLCITTRCIYNNYAYDYFVKALKNAAVQIDKTINPSLADNYSLFFISATLNELGHKDSFDKLIENNDPDILIQMGIEHVTNETNLVSAVADRYMKKIRKRYRGNKIMYNHIMDIHDKSIEQLDKERIKKIK